jgi:hypothetical protein
MPRSTVRTWVRSVTLAAASCLLLAGTASLAAAPATAAARAHSQPAVPDPGSGSQLRAVTCTSASNCWAVGDYLDGVVDASEALHWNGTAWTLVPTPNPADASNGHNILYGVHCVTATDCWAVGEYGASIIQHRTLALHWTGSSWSQVATPNPGGPPGAWFLAAVSCTAADNCWAVGHHSRPHGDNVNMALHWTGTSWSWVGTPQPHQGSGGYIRQLNAIRCLSRTDCWAVGSWASPPHNQVRGTEAFRWTGTRWTSVSTPYVGSEVGVACTARANCWAVTAGDTTVHWTGTRWSAVGTPHSASKQNRLLGVTCARATECWAAGILDANGAAGAAQLTDMLRWNGTKWTRVATPNPGGSTEQVDNGPLNELDGVACGSPSSCWAVGNYWDYSAQTRLSIALHWNGTSWSNG